MDVDNGTMSEKTLSRDDLFLLMKSYENSVQQNTILLSQQQKLIEQQTDMISKQGEVCTQVKEIVNKLGGCDASVEHVQDTVINTINSFGEAIKQETQKVSSAITSAITEQTGEMIINRSKCKEEHSNVITDSIKNHSNLNLRLYGLYALLSGIVISVITLAIRAF